MNHRALFPHRMDAPGFNPFKLPAYGVQIPLPARTLRGFDVVRGRILGVFLWLASWPLFQHLHCRSGVSLYSLVCGLKQRHSRALNSSPVFGGHLLRGFGVVTVELRRGLLKVSAMNLSVSTSLRHRASARVRLLPSNATDELWNNATPAAFDSNVSRCCLFLRSGGRCSGRRRRRWGHQVETH